MQKIPTSPPTIAYRDKTGNNHPISSMSDIQLIEALYDMLTRKARHNHKMNKLFAINDTLSRVTKEIHSELSTRREQTSDLNSCQIAADLGLLHLSGDDSQLILTIRNHDD